MYNMSPAASIFRYMEDCEIFHRSPARSPPRHVVIVEDIMDTARTLFALKNELLKREPESLKIVTLLDKPSRRVVSGFSADYEGFAIDDLFVVGYGLDCGEKFRNLPYIGILSFSTHINSGFFSAYSRVSSSPSSETFAFIFSSVRRTPSISSGQYITTPPKVRILM